MLSLMPSVRYSLFGSPPTLANGSTATESSGCSRKAKYVPAPMAINIPTMPSTKYLGRRLICDTTYSALDAWTTCPEGGDDTGGVDEGTAGATLRLDN